MSDDFRAEDFIYTAHVLRTGTDEVVTATLSNNLGIILNALDIAANVRALDIYRCDCGCEFPERLGKYGCPNCGGDSGAAKLMRGL